MAMVAEATVDGAVHREEAVTAAAMATGEAMETAVDTVAAEEAATAVHDAQISARDVIRQAGARGITTAEVFMEDTWRVLRWLQHGSPQCSRKSRTTKILSSKRWLRWLR